MPNIGSYEAKTNLSKLLARVKKGERFTITVHGHPVAELVPLPPVDTERAREALANLDKLRAELTKKGVTLKKILKKGETIRELAHSGHRV